MSGPWFYNRQKQVEAKSRRLFLFKAALVTTGILFNGCLRRFKSDKNYEHIKGSIQGPNAKAGHVLRDKLAIPQPTSTRVLKTLIIGGGISGLSAGRWLKKQGYDEFELLELEGHVGGNSYYKKNAVSNYPLGAHYITIANNEDKLLTDFLEEHGVITGYDDKGLPIYNEYYLCFDPEERLLINGQWQEGLVPDFGISPADRNEIKEFFKLVNQYKTAKGHDGKYAFDIPLDNSSDDERFRQLDKISFQDFLNDRKLTSPYLIWYLNYCCKDDYGQQIDKISAWAGIHYFAARRGKAANAEHNSVLTWSEGNGWLMQRLSNYIDGHIIKGSICYKITLNADNKVTAIVYDIVNNKTSTIIADAIIMATPQFVNNKLFDDTIYREVNYKKFNYSPWFVANIIVNGLPGQKGAGLCWDNVTYNTKSVGYVNAGHQMVDSSTGKKVLTWYLPLCDHEPRVARMAAYTRTYEQWLDIMLPELEYTHPGITEYIENVDCWIWGHGMIYPEVGYIWGTNRMAAMKPINNTIFFAHTDLSGVSIFEEAFHRGISAAKSILAKNES